MKRKMICPAFAATVLLGVLSSGVPAFAAGPATRPAETRPTIDDRAMTVFKGMGDKLKSAAALSFRAESAISIASPSGQWVHVFGTSRAILRRPDKLYVETRGDLSSENFYYDGAHVTMYAPEQNVYAQDAISGRVDQMLLQIYEKHGNYFPFADALHFDTTASMMRDVTSAQYVGTSMCGGVKCNHLAFAGRGLEWEIWIGIEDQLPRLLDVTFAEVDGRPHNVMQLSNWQLDPTDIPNDAFSFVPPAGSVRVEFRNPGQSAAVDPK